MTSIPTDLVPLPTAPYDVRPIELPLDIEECRTALWKAAGNVTKAAVILKVPSARLRKFVKNSPFLSAEADEAQQQIVDVAQDVVYEALTDYEEGRESRRDAMARFVMNGPGRDRGYGQASGSKFTVNNTQGGNITITWADGEAVTAPPVEEGTVIEHER